MLSVVLYVVLYVVLSVVPPGQVLPACRGRSETRETAASTRSE